MAYAVQATTHYQTYPERPPGADLPPKKVCNLDPMAARSRRIRQLPEGPQSRPARGASPSRRHAPLFYRVASRLTESRLDRDDTERGLFPRTVPPN